MKNKILSVSCIFLFLILASAIVSAQYGIPHKIFGSVVDSSGNPAPDNTLIIAKIEGDDVAAGVTKDGKYGYDPTFYVVDPLGNRDGEIVEFYINDLKVDQTIVFGNALGDRLDLVFPGSFGSSPPPSGGGGGGGGSDGGGGGSSGGGGGSSSSGSSGSGSSGTTSVTGTNADSESCTPNWECSDWLDCVGTTQKRVCSDTNNCGTEDGKPSISRECVSSDLQRSFILGAVIGPGGRVQPLGLVIFAAILLVAVIGVRAHFKRKSTNSNEKEPEEKA